MNKRTLSQIAILVLFFVVPIFDLFRIDLTHLHFFVLRRSFPFSQGFILLLVILILVLFFIAISKWFGRQFCGWMCPHNTFSGYLTKITGSKTLKNNKGLRNVIDIGLSIIFAPIIAFAFVSYFYNPVDLVNDIVSLNFGGWAFWAYIVIIAFFFIMINRLRHNFCRSACPYGMLQMILADKNSRQGGIKNMFRGVGLVLTLVLAVMISVTIYFIFTSPGYSMSIAKNKQLQGLEMNHHLIYQFDLTMENLKTTDESYKLELTGVPKEWNLETPTEITIPAQSTYHGKLLFKVTEASYGQNNLITITVKNTEGKATIKQINIFPVKK